jgi:MFS family permease
MKGNESLKQPPRGSRWLNGTVLGVGLASLFGDWSYETATTVLPAFLASLGVAAAWLGLIEGVSDGLSSFAKLASGFYTDRLKRRKPIAVWGYLVTAVATAAIGLASAAWHILVARSIAWLGRGVRAPVRKALLAASVDRDAYGRAFGLERMMDTIGAIVGPASALVLIRLTNSHFPTVFAWTLLPGLFAAAAFLFLVREKDRLPVSHISFRESFRSLPPVFRRYLVAVGTFGAGDFAHTMLILLAAQKLTPGFGVTGAASFAAGLYLLHNVLSASSAFASGWMADRADKRRILAAGYALAGVMALCIMIFPMNAWSLALVFVIGGIYLGIEDALEDSLCAELVEETKHGLAFGSLATVNGVGDFASSLMLGLLWSSLGTTVAFGYSAVLFFAGAFLIARLRSSPPN